MKIYRYRGIKTILLLVVIIGLLLADSGVRIVTTEYELSYAELPAEFDGFRILQLSDLHGEVFGRKNARLLRKAAAAKPDIIALTGDLADRDTDMADIDALLAALTEIAPVYYVSGNHEWSGRLLDVLHVLFKKYGVTYLQNEYVTLERRGAELLLAGVEDPNGLKDQPKPDEVIAGLRAEHPEEFTVLLGHRNDWAEKYPALPVQLVFCGHAHGGIVRLPGIGGLLGTGGTFFPDYTSGVYDVGTYRLVISRGIGGSIAVPRFLNNPELVSVTLLTA